MPGTLAGQAAGVLKLSDTAFRGGAVSYGCLALHILIRLVQYSTVGKSSWYALRLEGCARGVARRRWDDQASLRSWKGIRSRHGIHAAARSGVIIRPTGLETHRPSRSSAALRITS